MRSHGCQRLVYDGPVGRGLVRGATAAVGIALAVAACGPGRSSESATSADEACAFDGTSGSIRLESGSSNAHIWKDLTLELDTGRLTGRVSNVDEGEHRIDDIDETVPAAALSSLQERLRTTCGTLSPAEAPPDAIGGGTTTLTIQSPSAGSFALIGTGLTNSIAAGTRLLEASRDDYLQIVSDFPGPAP